MLKLTTYNRSQYEPLMDGFRSKGFNSFSVLELRESDRIAERLGENAVVDVSPLIPLFAGNPQLASSFELIIHLMPADVIFIGDEDTVSKGAYPLRTIFDTFENCGIEIEEGTKINDRKKRTLISLNEDEFASVLTTLKSELIGQTPFKRAFESHAQLQALQRTWRAANNVSSTTRSLRCWQDGSGEDSQRVHRPQPTTRQDQSR